MQWCTVSEGGGGRVAWNVPSVKGRVWTLQRAASNIVSIRVGLSLLFDGATSRNRREVRVSLGSVISYRLG